MMRSIGYFDNQARLSSDRADNGAAINSLGGFVGIGVLPGNGMPSFAGTLGVEDTERSHAFPLRRAAEDKPRQ